MIEILTSILGGGVTGILGSAVQKFFDYKTEKLKIEAARERFAHEANMARIDAEAKADVADAEALKASYNEPAKFSDNVKPTDKQGWVLIVMDVIRGLVRPCLTLYLCGITTVIYIRANALLDATAIPIDRAVDLVTLIINTVLYLTTTCVLWWFGSRNKNKGPKI